MSCDGLCWPKIVHDGHDTTDPPGLTAWQERSELESYLLPFQHGWRREIVFRGNNHNEGRKSGDVYYFSPNGQKLRSRVEIGKFIRDNGITSLTESNFSFRVEELLKDGTSKKEVVRNAKPVSRKVTDKNSKLCIKLSFKSKSKGKPFVLKVPKHIGADFESSNSFIPTATSNGNCLDNSILPPLSRVSLKYSRQQRAVPPPLKKAPVISDRGFKIS